MCDIPLTIQPVSRICTHDSGSMSGEPPLHRREDRQDTQFRHGSRQCTANIYSLSPHLLKFFPYIPHLTRPTPSHIPPIMCSYTYSWYYCSHDYYIWYAPPHPYTSRKLTLFRADSLEVCAGRLLSGYSYDAWSIDLCKNMKVSCGGYSNYYCVDCSEDVALEYELDEL
jgi:hypothetical protein